MADEATAPSDAEPAGERLAALERRLAEARARRAPRPAADEHFSQANVAWRMVTELVAGIGLGLAIGLGLDALMGTRPVMLVVFVLLGFAAGVRVMLRTAEEVRARAEAQGVPAPRIAEMAAPGAPMHETEDAHGR